MKTKPGLESCYLALNQSEYFTVSNQHAFCCIAVHRADPLACVATFISNRDQALLQR
jgi:hypothetical protein